jgi:mRNA-degrading endonuclease RelE of RelBE toxin-antitoxin system
VSAWEVRVAPEAADRISAMVHPVAASIVALLSDGLATRPHTTGLPLQRELTGYRAARSGNYRIVYRIDEESRTVLVVWIAHGTGRPDIVGSGHAG